MSKISEEIEKKIQNMSVKEFEERTPEETPRMKRHRKFTNFKNFLERWGISFGGSSGTSASHDHHHSCNHHSSNTTQNNMRDTYHHSSNFNPSREAYERANYEAYFKMIDGKGDKDYEDER